MIQIRLTVYVVLAALVSLVLSTPVKGREDSAKVPGAQCTTIDRRKEWRDMSVEQRLSYINAVLCLHSLPPNDKTRAATSRYEEFQATHILLTDRVHSVGHFLPWHRHLGTLYGKALREECGYDGPTAYWDWRRDADSEVDILKSPIFDPVTGFGGDGVEGTYTLPPDPNNEGATLPTFAPAPGPLPTGTFTFPGGTAPGPFPTFTFPSGTPPPPSGTPFPELPPGGGFPSPYKGCVLDGPFNSTNWRIHLGPGKLVTEHCLVRNISPFGKFMLTSEVVRNVMLSKNYEEFRLAVDSFQNGPIHGGGHVLVGGEMINVYSAGADPLFYLHHAGLDKVWWDWQQVDPTNRLYDVSGPTTQGGSIPITLDFELDFPALGPNITVRDTMDSALEPNCFTYE
ncbi:hypothetical protein D9611_010109 [Ephemerocybe angulata]|uniref:Tyrosinase copper-binding domain-containing protein n=1 Tax=Ephemerocybe angulata TaxID=980116 RepID=A0A8H5AZD0_9AGAR|nr:hypothetical protein D9611_010109 [Tulosesus angulatus]